MRVNRWFLACGAAALVLASAAIGAGGGSGTLAACAQEGSGQLRLDSGGGCRTSEEAVALGTGASSRADERYYVAPNLADPSTFLPIGNGPANRTAIVTSHVPAGNDAIAAQVTFHGNGGTGDVPCILVEPSGTTHGYAEESYSAGFNQTMTIDGALSLAADTDISLVCWNIPFGGGSASVRAADITTKSVDAASITQETH